MSPTSSEGVTGLRILAKRRLSRSIDGLTSSEWIGRGAKQDIHQKKASTTSLPLQQIPDRTSSLNAPSRQHALGNAAGVFPPVGADGLLVPSRGRAESPVKRTVVTHSVSSDVARFSPSKTFIRTRPPLKSLDTGTHHSRVTVTSHLPSKLAVGGSTVEGVLTIGIDQHEHKPSSKPLLLSKLSVDVVGMEQVSDGRK